MAVKLIHVILLLITVIVVLVRQKCVTAATTVILQSWCLGKDVPTKPRKRCEKHSSFDDPNLTVMPPISNAYYLGPQCSWLHHVWPRLQRTAMPRLKYKRDPIIIIDNEDIGRHPRGNSSHDHTAARLKKSSH
ncbi:unnamed protein product [Arctia plantaginis]|uniref:Secreted protein n=1 Tax=Arctia plantaginis TaxID=874455 RepID=A0A8S1B0Q2_ARCPL|nr:unnamed protein product [Arctia plantaginis]